MSETIIYDLGENALTIFDSYKVEKNRFKPILAHICGIEPSHPIWINRSLKSLKKEWATHNLCYALNIQRNRTKNVDLNTSLKWYVEVVYAVVGTIALIFIK